MFVSALSHDMHSIKHMMQWLDRMFLVVVHSEWLLAVFDAGKSSSMYLNLSFLPLSAGKRLTVLVMMIMVIMSNNS